MEGLIVLKVISRWRIVLAIGLLVAVAAAFAVGRPQSTKSGVALTRVALDTPNSQIVYSAPTGAGTLPWRASLLTHLVASEAIKREIAQRMGIHPYELAVVDPTLVAPPVPSSLPKAAAEVAAINPAPYVVTTYLTNGGLPIISIGANAPDRAAAARLAAATADVIKSEAGSGHGDTELQRFVIQSVAPIHAKTLVTTGKPVKAVALLIFVFGLWCAGLGTFIGARKVLPRLRAHVRATPTA
jgi:hypothetical protein